jgi:nucleoside 2-deoxyribosyltransferase
LSKLLVYLAGPIDGLTYKQGQTWRDYVTEGLPQEIDVLSPLRGQEGITHGIIRDSYEAHPITTARGIRTRCKMDVKRADVVLMNLLGARKISIGTMIEVGWADALGIPIILVMESSVCVNLHDHPIVREAAGWQVETLDDAIMVCTSLLPGGKGTARELPAPSLLETYAGLALADSVGQAA